ncbi:MAG: thiamine pyrophosphate-dependent dehydrogenase E1 component subunit alpha [Dehalococcoidia bacterium]
MAYTGERSPSGVKTPPQHRILGFSDVEILDFYAQMVLARTLDERLWALNRQGKVPLVASCQGTEAASMALAYAALKDGDYFLFPYYRDMPLKLVIGVTPLEIMIGHYGKAGDTFSGGRQFLLQGSSAEHRMIHLSNVVGSNLTQAVGYALGCKTLGEKTVVLVTFGDGGSSEGECHEAMNFAGIHKLPVIFLCYNNRLAISVPQEKQMAIQDLADRAAGYGFPGYVVDGTDSLRIYQRIQEAIERAREESGGPTFLELKVERFKPHTSDDDHRRYRTAEDIEASMGRDPLLKLYDYVTEVGILTQDEDEKIQGEARRKVNEATDAVEKAPWPDPSTLLDHLYAP